MDSTFVSHTLEQAIAKAAVIELLALVVMWFLYAYLYRPYRIDLMRQRLFSLRRQLFSDAVGSDEFPHDGKAYIEMRSIINGMIRFAHELTLFEFVSIYALQNQSDGLDYRVEVKKSFDELPPHLRERLLGYQQEITWIVSDHIAHASVPLFVTIVPITHLLDLIGRGVSKVNDQMVKLRIWLNRLPVFAVLEKQARESGRTGCTA